jgi:hypothetical protein
MESDHLYWSDYNNMKLLRSDLDGSNRIEILTGLINPVGITLDKTMKILLSVIIIHLFNSW